LDAAPGAAVYNPWFLHGYDWIVHGLSNAFAWRCPTRLLRDLYDRHLSNAHLDVGVGSGYFLDRCRFPTRNPEIVLVDLNSNSLRFTARRIRRYQPIVHRANVLEPLELDRGPFHSIGMMYLLHCLPGALETKTVAFDHLGRYLAPDGVLFGATILGKGVPHTRLARRLMRLYNSRGIFGNANDSLSSLEQALSSRFEQTHVQVHGSVALFEAKRWRSVLPQLQPTVH
jgi:ubiquinone/menaquinone biosynthesis C-methylase UbiE